MKQMILRILQNKSEVEILEKDEFEREYFKEIELNSLIEKLKEFTTTQISRRSAPIMFSDEVIGASSDCVVIKQAGRKRDVIFDNKAYSINFPNAIYIMDISDNKIKKIEVYCYIEFVGMNTELFEYAMPNVLSGNCICIGGAPRNIENKDYLLALEKIIYAPYSHNTFSGLYGFKSTKQYFEHLETHEYPYNLLIGLNRRLKSVINNGG